MTVSRQAVEQVLVVPTLLFHEIGHFQGFCSNAEPYLKTLLDPTYTSYRARDTVENDPSYKQLIPYCIFRCAGQVFHYRRGGVEGEDRLRRKRSIGVGGHVSSRDQSEETDSYLEGMHREIGEEVCVETSYTYQCVGLINDDQTDVGRVHLGIVHIFDLDEPKVRPREESIIETGFSAPSELLRDRDAFETWSQICLDHLFADQDGLAE